MARDDLEGPPVRGLKSTLGNGRNGESGIDRTSVRREGIPSQQAFHTMLTLERRRAERSRRPFVLLLLDSHALRTNGIPARWVERLTSVVCGATRETDIVGWYEDGVILAVIFTEIDLTGKIPITELLGSKVVAALQEQFDHAVVSKLVVTARVYPESWDKLHRDRVADSKIYPDLSPKDSKKRFQTLIKRGIDIVGSATLLLLFSPVLAAIALAIKLTSKGSIIFEQDRLGQFGTTFTCLKFRTMHMNSDSRIHFEYINSFIAGRDAKGNMTKSERAIYKITDDPRITRVGKFLRRISFDEFPQLWNVLRGEMSLVGPRPPLPYEFDVYDYWHRRRICESKPGVTGLWQVNGRSRVCFDDMVRLDLRYSREWSLWLDLKILLATPLAVLTGIGAF
jgi:lipopolysaccharide/colanic/teichoic acid biosynthesis glycosyltransferase